MITKTCCIQSRVRTNIVQNKMVHSPEWILVQIIMSKSKWIAFTAHECAQLIGMVGTLGTWHHVLDFREMFLHLLSQCQQFLPCCFAEHDSTTTWFLGSIISIPPADVDCGEGELQADVNVPLNMDQFIHDFPLLEFLDGVFDSIFQEQQAHPTLKGEEEPFLGSQWRTCMRNRLLALYVNLF